MTILSKHKATNFFDINCSSIHYFVSFLFIIIFKLLAIKLATFICEENSAIKFKYVYVNGGSRKFIITLLFMWKLHQFYFYRVLHSHLLLNEQYIIYEMIGSIISITTCYYIWQETFFCFKSLCVIFVYNT